MIPFDLWTRIDQATAEAKNVRGAVAKFDPGNGDMLLYVACGGEPVCYRFAPEIGAEFRDTIWHAVKRQAN